MSRPAYIWSVAALVYVAFAAWYTNLRGPLTPDEVELYVERMAESGAEQADLARLRRFLEEDAGDDFIMVNAILMRERPLRREGVGPDETSQEVLGRYMAYMWPALLQRACHPVLFGDVVGDAPEVWGLENARRWTSAGLMRYRSRRDLMEIAAAPEFSGPHQFKIAAMEKTVAFPVEASLQLGDPRLLLALILFSLSAALQLLQARPRPPARSPLLLASSLPRQPLSRPEEPRSRLRRLRAPVGRSEGARSRRARRPRPGSRTLAPPPSRAT